MDEIIVEFYQQKNYKCINIWTEEAFKQKSAHSRKTHKISKKWISVWNLLIFNKINLFLWKVVNTERLLGGSRQIYDWKTNQKVLSDLISPTKPLEKTVCSSFFEPSYLVIWHLVGGSHHYVVFISITAVNERNQAYERKQDRLEFNLPKINWIVL